jgi:hypothetical protein
MLDSPSVSSETALRRRSGFGLLALALVALAWANRLTVDDAFIYYRYARHWLDGLGLVWNPGESVEGFTSLPWVLWVAACLRAGLDPASSGLVFFGGALAFLWAAALRAAGSTALGLLAVAVYGTNYTISCFATGGLETSAHLMLLAAGCWALLRLPHTGGFAALSVIAGLAFCVRMDSVPFVVPLLAGGAWLARGAPDGRRRLVALAVPAEAIALAFLALRLWLFRELVPNTFWVKLAGARALGRGWDYAALFHHDYLLPLVLLPALVAWLAVIRASRSEAGIAAALAGAWLAWCGWAVWIGGDFMEFRMMTPALAPLLLLALAGWRAAPSLRVPIVAALVVVGLHNLAIQLEMRRAASDPFSLALSHNRFPFYAIPPAADSVPLLGAHLDHPQDDWIGAGRRLGEVFERSPDLLIATTAAGAIPYFSGLRTIDMLGLNDRWIARSGRDVSTRPGHARGATTDYLLERGVDLVLAHPLTVPRERLPEALAGVPPSRFWFDEPPPDARLLALPVNESHALVMLYLGRHPAVERAIERRQVLVLRTAGAARGPG